MHPYDARLLALELMRQHGLDGWKFQFDHARRRFGSCRCDAKLITLSRPLAILNSESQVRDTILHEIAHALTPGTGHGAAWRRMCRRIGASPKRCYDDETVVSPARRAAPYELGCAKCDWWIDRRRRARIRYICKHCRGNLSYRHKTAQVSV